MGYGGKSPSSSSPSSSPSASSPVLAAVSSGQPHPSTTTTTVGQSRSRKLTRVPKQSVAEFRDGVTDLLAGKWDRFNADLQARQAALANVLNSGACRVRVVLAYTGTAVSDDRRDIFGDLERA